MTPPLILAVASLVVCAIAVATDLRAFLIPNWLTFSGGVLAFGLVTLLGLLGQTHLYYGLVSACAGSLAALLLFWFLGLLNVVGMGDVKLMAVVGAFWGVPDAFVVMLFVLIAGGLLGIVYPAIRGELGAVLRNLRGIGRPRPAGGGGITHLHRVPYALAIFGGTLAAAVLRWSTGSEIWSLRGGWLT